MNQRRRKFYLGILAILSFGLLLMVVVSYWILPYNIVQPYRYRIANHPEFRIEALQNALRSYPDSNFFLTMPDGTRIAALLHTCERPKSTIIMLCGIGACKEMNLPVALDFLNAGHQCLLIDVRAQGASDGTFMTYGFYEKQDVKECVDFLEQRFSSLPVGVLGFSLGGAIALQSMDADPRIRYGCILSTFDAMETVVNLYASRAAKGLPLRPITDLAIAGAESMAKFEADSVRPSVASSRILRPVLFVHGDQDQHIPWKYGYENYLACSSPLKQWLLVQGANHNNLIERGGEALKTQLIDFADKQSY